MKYIIALIVATSLFSNAFSQSFNESKIDFELSNLPDGVTFYLIRNNDQGMTDTIETVNSLNGQVNFKSRLLNNGELYFIQVDREKAKLSEKRKDWIRFLIDKQIIYIKGDFSNWPLLSIEGSEATTVYEKYHALSTPFIDSLRSISVKMSAGEFKDSNQLKTKIAEYKQHVLDYFKIHKDALSIPLLVSRSMALDVSDKKKLLELMSVRQKESYYGKKLESDLKSSDLQHFTAVVIGGKIPDFKVESLNGEKISIREMALKSSYTLIDFWAYWCRPCREEIPAIKKVYNQFKGRGFSVLGVSIDPNHKAWAKALDELSTEWSNGIDRDQVCKKLFSISAIPGYVLLNSKAEVIAMDVFGNKNNGASSKYFSSKTSDFRLNGMSMYEIIDGLFKLDIVNR